MTVIGRLWRRAPAFRACVVLAIAGSALGAMFPPRLPASMLDSLQGRKHGLDEQAHYRPPADAPPPDYSLLDLPPLRDGRSILIPFAGRQLPLPAGKWVEVALARDHETPPVQAIVLARIQSSTMTGMILVTGTPPVAPTALAPPQFSPCNDGTTQVTAGQDCWNTGQLITAQLRRPDAELLLKRSLDQLDNLGVILPARLAGGSFVRLDGSGALTVKLMFAEPATGALIPAMSRRMDNWMRRWVPLLHRGFDGALKPADITVPLAHDPAAESGPS
jgi:hypothetical protein